MSIAEILAAAETLANGGSVDIALGSTPENVLSAAVAALVIAVKELAVDMSDRFAPHETLAIACASILDHAIRERAAYDYMPPQVNMTKAGWPPPKPKTVLVREVERDSEGRITRLIDVAVPETD